MTNKAPIPRFYSYDRLDSTGMAIRIAFGGRRTGKTFGARSKLIDTTAEDRKFVYLRKWHSMITAPKMEQLFVKQDKECVSKIGSEIGYSRAKMAFVRYGDTTPIGWARSLEDAYDFKGEDFPGLKTIYFDEFLDDGVFKDEFSYFQQAIATLTGIADDITIYMTTNTISRDNVYFRNFGIDIARMRPGDIAICRHDYGAEVAAEYVRSMVYQDPITGKVSNRYVGFDSSPDTKMILLGEWSHPPIETREIDGVTWASNRYVFPLVVYTSLGAFYEMSMDVSHEVAFVREINAQSDRLGKRVARVITPDFSRTFRRSDGTIVPKYATFASTGSDDLLEAVRLFRRYRSAGRIIGTEPVETHDFLRLFDSMPI